MYPVAIEGPRLVLRELRPDDVESVAKITADAVALEHMPLDYMDHDEAEGYVTQLIEAAEDPSRFVYALAIARPIDDQLLGIAQLSVESFTHRRAELGYLVCPEYWGQGFGREAAALLGNFGFDHLGLARIWAVTAVENTNSARLLDALGFEREGTLRRHLLIHGGWHDAYLYALVRRVSPN